MTADINPCAELPQGELACECRTGAPCGRHLVEDDWSYTRPNFDLYFLAMARTAALRADCRRRQVGAVIVDDRRRLVISGYNGAPPGKPGCLAGACPRGLLSGVEVAEYSSYDTGPGACISIHAEANCLIHGDATRMRGGAIYITDAPCLGCMKLLAGSGLVKVRWPTGGYQL